MHFNLYAYNPEQWQNKPCHYFCLNLMCQGVTGKYNIKVASIAVKLFKRF